MRLLPLTCRLLSIYESVKRIARNLHFSYIRVKRNGERPDIRAEAASRAPGRDAAADRGRGGRAPHDARPFPDDGAGHRREGGRHAADGVRALSRRALALPSL